MLPTQIKNIFCLLFLSFASFTNINALNYHQTDFKNINDELAQIKKQQKELQNTCNNIQNYNTPQEQTWGQWTYDKASSAAGLIIIAVVLPRAIEFINDQINNYSLSDEQKRELQEDKETQKILQRQQKEINRIQIEAQKDPQWKQIALDMQKQQLQIQNQTLYENELILRENELNLLKKAREEEEKQIKHLKSLIAHASPENRESLQKKIDVSLNAMIEKRSTQQ